MKTERIKDYHLLEERFISNQERLKPELREEKNEEDQNKVDEMRGTPINIGTLEEIIDDDQTIVTSPTGSIRSASQVPRYIRLI